MSLHFSQLLSDWHLGKTTRYGYDVDEANKRLGSVPQKMAAALNTHPVTDIWLLLLGDNVHGTGIYPHQDATMQIGVMDQKRCWYKGVDWIARDLHKRYRKAMIHLVGVPGNHGRHSLTGDPIDNHDTECHERLEELLFKEQWADVRVSRYAAAVVDIGGLRTVCVHKMKPKPSHTPVAVGRNRDWLEFFDADFIASAHHHTPTMIQSGAKKPIRMCNGSGCGVDDLAEQNGWFAPPWQGWFWVEDGELTDWGWLKWRQGRPALLGAQNGKAA